MTSLKHVLAAINQEMLDDYDRSCEYNHEMECDAMYLFWQVRTDVSEEPAAPTVTELRDSLKHQYVSTRQNSATSQQTVKLSSELKNKLLLESSTKTGILKQNNINRRTSEIARIKRQDNILQKRTKFQPTVNINKDTRI